MDDEDESNFSLILRDKDQKECKTMTEKSPFGKMFKDLYVKASERTCTDGDLYHLPEFTKSLLNFFMPLTPLWTGLIISDGDNKITR